MRPAPTSNRASRTEGSSSPSPASSTNDSRRRNMIGMAAVRRRNTTLLDVHNVGAGGLSFRFHQTIERIAQRFGRQVALSWTQGLLHYTHNINTRQLEAAITSGNLARLEAVVDLQSYQRTLGLALRDPLMRAVQAGGMAS